MLNRRAHLSRELGSEDLGRFGTRVDTCGWGSAREVSRVARPLVVNEPGDGYYVHVRKLRLQEVR